MWGCFLKVLLQTKKTLTLLAVNLSTRSFFENRNVSYTPCNIPLPPPSHPSRSPNSYEISDWPTPIDKKQLDKSNWNTPRKKNPVSLNARVFQSPIYNHISTPSPLFQCCNHVTVHGAYFNIEMGEREVWLSTKKFILLKCVNTLSDCSLLWRPRSCPHYNGGKLRPFPGKHIIFSVHTTRDKCKNATSIILGLYEENRKEFSKSSVSKMFSVRT